MAEEMFEDVKAQIERIKQVRPAIEALVNGIADRVAAAVEADNAGDRSILESLSGDLRNEADALAGLAVANTPAEPPSTEGVITGDKGPSEIP